MSTATPTARPGRRSRSASSRSGARSCRRSGCPTAASSTCYAADGADGDAPRRRREGLLLAGPLDQPRRPARSSAWAAPARSDPTTAVLLDSGDVVVFGGPARLAYHGIDRIRAGSSTPAAGGRADQPDLPGGGLSPGSSRRLTGASAWSTLCEWGCAISPRGDSRSSRSSHFLRIGIEHASP